MPAVHVPMGFSATGMPIGVQLIGPRYSECLLLALADRLERLSGYTRAVHMNEHVFCPLTHTIHHAIPPAS